MGLLNYLGGRGSSAFGEGSSRHVESDVGGVTVGGVALEEEKSWEQPDPSVDNLPFTSFDEARPSDGSRRRSSAAADRDHGDRDMYDRDGINGQSARPATVHKSNCRGSSQPLPNHGLHATPDSLIDLRTAREFGRDSIQLFVTIMIAIGFLDTLADPEEGRRVLASCGVKVTRLRSTLTALLVWFVLVSLVRALALTVFEVVTDFNAERGNVENGKV